MWLFTQHGFFSATKNHDDDRIMVRARCKQHLVNLIARFEDDEEVDQLTKAEKKIITTPDADYRYRIIIDRDVWGQWAGNLAFDTDYSNFKSRCHEQQMEGEVDAKYVSALHQVWGVMHDKYDDGKGPYTRFARHEDPDTTEYADLKPIGFEDDNDNEPGNDE